MFRRSVLRTLALALVLPSCTAPLATKIPSELSDVPWRGGPGDQRTLRARRMHDRGEAREALALIDEVLGDHPRHIDAQRLRQDLLRERGRFGRVLVEAQERIRAWGDEAAARYLRGRVQISDKAKSVDFEAALTLRPDLFWGWLGLAFAHRATDLDTSLAIYQRLYAASGQHPTPRRASSLIATAASSTTRASAAYRSPMFRSTSRPASSR